MIDYLQYDSVLFAVLFVILLILLVTYLLLVK